MAILMPYQWALSIQESPVPSRREAPTTFADSLNWTRKVLGIGSSIIKLDAMACHLCKQSEVMLSFFGHEKHTVISPPRYDPRFFFFFFFLNPAPRVTIKSAEAFAP